MAETEIHEEVARRRFLDRAWLSFVSDGVESDGLSEPIVRSWRRSRDTFGIDPALKRCQRLLTPAELLHRQERDDAYRLARTILEEFASRLRPARQVITYFDAAGWMLSVGGSPGVAEQLAEINFCPGANWREEAAGTNGPGIAFAERRPLEVFASEHFVEAWQAWNCSAAPVLAPGTGALLGLVDITGPWTAHEVQGLVAARAIAVAIEERLRAADAVRDQVVEYAFRQAPRNGDGLFAVDRRGRVLAADECARRRLALGGESVPATVRDLLISSLEERTPPRDLSVDWPGGPRDVRLSASPVRYGADAVGAVVRVLGPATARARAPGRTSAPVAVARYGFEHVLGESESILRATALARRAAGNDLPVVLIGESGTGKELFAQAIHTSGARRAGPFIAVNCGSIPATLLEAELFGYEAGTFTGARKEGSAGKFEEAAGGTLFLDEVSELSPQAQAALLRVLQEREVVRLGGSAPRRIDLRVVAASNRALSEEIRAGRFRNDLFFRLNVLTIAVPPLRERRGDVPLLARAFLRDAEREVGRSGLRFADEALAALCGYDWPGNIRELRNVVLRLAATVPQSTIDLADLPEEVRAAPALPAAPPSAAPAPPAAPAVPAAPAPRSAPASAARPAPDPDREGLLSALDGSGWNVARAAVSMGVSRMTLYRWLHRHGIDPRDHRRVS